jgi:hypothetical protein
MVSLLSLWLPIVLAGAAVFFISSLMHMLLKYHQSDFKSLPDQDRVMAALRPFNIQPGDYFMPYSRDMKERGAADFQEKFKNGPVGTMTIMPNGAPAMGGSLVMWYGYAVIVSIFVAYVTALAVPAGGDYLMVFRIAGTVAFVGYSLALMQNSIWYKRNWTATLKSMFDGLIYALLTAGVFGWLWP